MAYYLGDDLLGNSPLIRLNEENKKPFWRIKKLVSVNFSGVVRSKEEYYFFISFSLFLNSMLDTIYSILSFGSF